MSGLQYSQNVLNFIDVFKNLMSGQIETMLEIEKVLEQGLREYLFRQMLMNQNIQKEEGVQCSQKLEETQRKASLIENKQLYDKKDNDSNQTSRIVSQNDDIKNDQSPVTVDNNKSTDDYLNDQMNIDALQEEELDVGSNSHTEISKTNEQQNDKNQHPQNQKKIQTQKKIKKQKKKFCISQNPSLSQIETPVSTKNSKKQQKEFNDNIFNLSNNSSNNNQNSYNNFKYSQKNTSQILNQLLSSEINKNHFSTPQKQYNDEFQSSQNNNFYDSFFNGMRSTYQKGNCYQFKDSNSNKRQIPSCFVANDQIEELNNSYLSSYKSSSKQRQEYQLLNPQGQLNEQVSSPSQNNQNQINTNKGIDIQQLNNKTKNNQIINSNDKQQITSDQLTLKQEKTDEIQPNNQESNSNSKTLKKSKKFPSVIFVKGDKLFQCQICNRTFDSKQKLGGHKARAHPDAPCQRTEREQKKKNKNLETPKSTNYDHSFAQSQQLLQDNPLCLNSFQSQKIIEEKNEPNDILNSTGSDLKYQNQLLQLSQNSNKSQQPRNGFKQFNPQSHSPFSRNLSFNTKPQQQNNQYSQEDQIKQFLK